MLSQKRHLQTEALMVDNTLEKAPMERMSEGGGGRGGERGQEGGWEVKYH